MKVLGVKVNNEVYEMFASLDGSISDNMRKAIGNYLNINVEKPLTVFKTKVMAFEYHSIGKKVDDL